MPNASQNKSTIPVILVVSVVRVRPHFRFTRTMMASGCRPAPYRIVPDITYPVVPSQHDQKPIRADHFINAPSPIHNTNVISSNGSMEWITTITTAAIVTAMELRGMRFRWSIDLTTITPRRHPPLRSRQCMVRTTRPRMRSRQ